jgi:crotonobetainyl-CoA:carnitine CoA-transferase CaiB-like acyl-CoA transferase
MSIATSFCVYESAHYFATGARPPRMGQAHRGSAPYQCFATADGHITVGASQQRFFEAFCALAGLPDLPADPRFRSNADRVGNNDALVAILSAPLRARESAHWLAALEQAGIPAGPVLHFDEVFTDPHFLARDMVAHTEHPETGRFGTLGVPLKLSATPGAVRRPAPPLGEHGAEIFPARKAAE